MSGQNPSSKGFLHGILIIPGIAFAYYLTGKLGVLLAIPPGYATAIWPASGIALAGMLIYGYRVAPGILLGSLLVNLEITYNRGGSLGLNAFLLAGSIGLGAALQAGFGTWLIRKFGAIVSELENERGILLVYFLGGPISCLVGCTWGTATLYLFGAMPIDAVAENHLTWWMGDILGVIVFTPVLLLMFSQSSSLYRKSVVVGSLLFVFLLVTGLFVLAKQETEERNRLEFERRTLIVEAEFTEKIKAYENIVASIEGLFNASTEVSYAEFEAFSSGLLSRYPGIQALSWNARVTNAERTGFEASMRKRGFHDFEIKARYPDGTMKRSPENPLYFPVTYVVPPSRNRAAHGFDTFQQGNPINEMRVRTLEKARDSGTVQSTSRLAIVQDKDDRYSLIFYCPIYHQHAFPTNVEERRQYHLGFAAGVFVLPDVLSPMQSRAENRDIAFRLLDRTSENERTLLYDSQTADHKESESSNAGTETEHHSYYRTAKINQVGRNWELEFFPAVPVFAAQSYWSLWAVMIGGLSFTALVGLCLLILTGRTARIERLVEQRTGELDRANQSLRKSNEDLENSNIELKQFAYVASHDLQTPLRGITGFAQLLESDLKDHPSENAAKFLQRIVGSAKRMSQLINDLLDYSRVESRARPFVPVDLNEVFTDTISLLEMSIQDARATVSSDRLPTVQGDRAQLVQLFQNLIGNGIKYHGETNPVVHVSSETNETSWTITIQDNGIGIAEKHLEKIFDIFRRLHTEEQYPGTGIGLAICRRIVLRHGGQINVTSVEGTGSQFSISLPKSSNEILAKVSASHKLLPTGSAEELPQSDQPVSVK